MHIWSLHFGSILILVHKLILLLMKSLKKANRFNFGPYRQPTNGNLLRGRRSNLLADEVALMWC